MRSFVRRCELRVKVVGSGRMIRDRKIIVNEDFESDFLSERG